MIKNIMVSLLSRILKSLLAFLIIGKNTMAAFLSEVLKLSLTSLIMIRTIMIAFWNGINSKPLKGEPLL